MKKIPLITLALAAGVALSGPALARRGDIDRYQVRYDWATVIDVDPIVERSRRPVSREVCYDQPVDRYEPGYTAQRNHTGATVLGAVIGGALGNQVGKGDGRKAATIAGAVIGGAVGNNASQRRGDYYQTSGGYVRDYETRCRQETAWRGDDDIVGYQVSYRYRGDIFHTTMDHHPGNRLRVRVDRGVTPAE